MASRPPNYSQERLQRERKQRAKADERAERNAEKTAARKAAKAEGSPDTGGSDSKDNQ